MARRDDREYREYLREEQRSQPGCPAREVVLDQREQATSIADRDSGFGIRDSGFASRDSGICGFGSRHHRQRDAPANPESRIRIPNPESLLVARRREHLERADHDTLLAGQLDQQPADIHYVAYMNTWRDGHHLQHGERLRTE